MLYQLLRLLAGTSAAYRLPLKPSRKMPNCANRLE